MVALRPATHDSGSGWFATPFLCDSFIHDSTPVYPGALRKLLGLSLAARYIMEGEFCIAGRLCGPGTMLFHGATRITKTN